MTDNRDFKRLVRERMAKTGESYTAARAQLRRDAQDPPTSIAALEKQTFTRAATRQLSAHLGSEYGIDVLRTTELDTGVHRVDRRDGPSWIARVFPAVRSSDAVTGDVELLRHLAEQSIPAERCAATEPMSTLAGQGVLVTEYVPGVNARNDNTGRTMHALGETLGRLHSLPIPSFARPAGGWHHLSPNGGGRRADIEALLPVFDEAASSLSKEDRRLHASLSEELAGVECGDGLPEALVHPDPVGANAIVLDVAPPVLVDWTGAGRGARLTSFANLVSSCGDLRGVNAVVAGYREHVRLLDDELARLAPAIRAFPFVLDCWSVVFQGAPLRDVGRRDETRRDRADVMAERVQVAFDAPAAELIWWDDLSSKPAQIEGQGTLL